MDFQFVRSIWRELCVALIVAAIISAIGKIYANVPPAILFACAAGIVFIVALILFFRRPRKVLVYVSSGGTCRDPMAKAITEQLLKNVKLKYPIDIYAVGMNPSDNETTASFAAQQTIKDMYNHDLLKKHRPMRISSRLMDKADLILVMDRHLFEGNKSTFPLEKTHVFQKFFTGVDGDIPDPYELFGAKDPVTLARYKACAEEIKKIISNNLGVLLKALGEA